MIAVSSKFNLFSFAFDCRPSAYYSNDINYDLRWLYGQILWISTLLVSTSLAYERRADQGYALPAQGYAIAPATDFGPSAGYGAPQAVPAQGYGAPVPYSGSSYQVPLDYPEEGMFKYIDS